MTLYFIGADERNRTLDLLITNELLYRLSYIGLKKQVFKYIKLPVANRHVFGLTKSALGQARCAVHDCRLSVPLQVCRNRLHLEPLLPHYLGYFLRL